MIIKRKLFTKYDDTDNLKRMKDSDILAEKPKQAPGYGSVAGAALGGAALGGTVGAVAGAFGKNKAGRSLQGGKTGLVVGGLLAGGMALRNRNKQAENNEWYNKRLNYAQRQARRREKQDWKTNMTQRDGYSY